MPTDLPPTTPADQPVVVGGPLAEYNARVGAAVSAFNEAMAKAADTIRPAVDACNRFGAVARAAGFTADEKTDNNLGATDAT